MTRKEGRKRNGGKSGKGSLKRRLCVTFPDVHECRNASNCPFAHSRKELHDSLTELEEVAFTDDLPMNFYTDRFKTIWCPIGIAHDWQACPYAHNYQDSRRSPAIGYGSKPCPDWDKEFRAINYKERCPRGFFCPYSHGAKEQLYHPYYYKTVGCIDLQKGKTCPRGRFCAFHHGEHDKVVIDKVPIVDYGAEVASGGALQKFYDKPPFGDGVAGSSGTESWHPSLESSEFNPFEKDWVDPYVLPYMGMGMGMPFIPMYHPMMDYDMMYPPDVFGRPTTSTYMFPHS